MNAQMNILAMPTYCVGSLRLSSSAGVGESFETVCTWQYEGAEDCEDGKHERLRIESRTFMFNEPVHLSRKIILYISADLRKEALIYFFTISLCQSTIRPENMSASAPIVLYRSCCSTKQLTL